MLKMKKRLSIAVLVPAILLLLGIGPDVNGPLFSFAWGAERGAVGTIKPDQLTKAIHLSAGYLIRQCRESGKFRYRINLNPAIKPRPRYNLLRHAGAIFALAAYDRTYPAKLTQNALMRAADFLKESAIAPLPGRQDLLAVWSHPEITRSNKPLQAKLGGTGLGLVALLAVETSVPGTTPLAYLRKMGNFVEYMQKSDGSFYSKFICSAMSPNMIHRPALFRPPGRRAMSMMMQRTANCTPLNTRQRFNPGWMQPAD